VRISELSEATGTPVPTIKYYLREGLLDRGSPTAPNQADYGEEHVRRLRLIRVLMNVGELSVADVRAVVDALSDETTPVHQVVGLAQYALGPQPTAANENVRRAEKEVDAFLAERKWRVHQGAPARRALAEALVSLRSLGQDATTELFAPYADLADELASWELDFIPAQGSRSAIVEAAVVGTIVFEAVLTSLRRLAHEHHSERRFSRRR
jgi:DNA-binding transcriptional MerR regulator